ncbi:MAG: antitoxin [Vulcanisaeta sp.]
MSVVLSVRIPKRLKEELDRLGIDYAKEIREYLERRVREELAKRLNARYDELLRESPVISGNLAVEFIREDRNAR